MERVPKTGEFYRHFKNKLYQIVTVAEHTETGERLVVYQALYGDYRTYARPLSMFTSEVDHEKYPEAAQKYRFERVIPGKNGEWRESFAGMQSGVMDGGDAEGMDGTFSECAAEAQVNPYLEHFLDAEGYEKQLEALNQMWGRVGQTEMDSIYLVLDITPAAGEINEQLRRVIRHLETRRKYDGRRLR